MGAALAGAQAQPASPGAAFYNPASIVGVDGVESSLTVTAGIINSSYENASGTLLGAVPIQGRTSGEAIVPDVVTLHSGYAIPVTDRLFIGAAINIPFGFASEYAEDSVIRYHGFDSKVLALSLTPIVGFAVNENWSIAAGPRIQYFDVTIESAIDAAGIATALGLPGFIPGTDDAFSKTDADDFGFGFVAGFEGRIARNVRLGASFTSKIEHDFDGDVDFDVSGSTAAQALGAFGLFQEGGISSSLTAPASIQAGVSIDASPRTTVLASVTLDRWSKFEEIRVDFDNPAQPAEVVTQNWRDAWSFSAGAEYDLSEQNTARFGVMYEQSPVNENFASTRIPDADRVWVAAGFTRELNDKATLHLGAAYLFFEEIVVNQPETLAENVLRGSIDADLDNSTLLLSAGVDWRF